MVHAGTNNCTNERKFETAEADLRGLVDDVQRRTPNTAVILSTVCPRADADGRHQRKVDKLNSKIRRLAESKGCLLVDMIRLFKIHNVADTSLLNSGKLHLNKTGTRWLLMNINKVHAIIRSSTRRSSSISQQDQRQRGYSPAETRPRHPRTTPRRRNFTYKIMINRERNHYVRNADFLTTQLGTAIIGDLSDVMTATNLDTNPTTSHVHSYANSQLKTSDKKPFIIFWSIGFGQQQCKCYKFGILNDKMGNDFTQADDNVANNNVCCDEQNISEIDVIKKKSNRHRRGQGKSAICRKPDNCFNIAFNNVNRIRPKLHEISKLIQDHNIHILGVAETFLKRDDVINNVNWSVVAERSSLPDSSSGVSSRMWVRIPAVTLVSLSKTLNHNCFSPPRG